MEYNPFSLKGKTILITGAAGGFGTDFFTVILNSIIPLYKMRIL